jgi:hypothetical protein
VLSPWTDLVRPADPGTEEGDVEFIFGTVIRRRRGLIVRLWCSVHGAKGLAMTIINHGAQGEGDGRETTAGEKSKEKMSDSLYIYHVPVVMASDSRLSDMGHCQAGDKKIPTITHLLE